MLRLVTGGRRASRAAATTAAAYGLALASLLAGCSGGARHELSPRAPGVPRFQAPTSQPTPEPSSTVTARPTFRALSPTAAKGGPAPNGQTLLRINDARGARTLDAITPRGAVLYVTFVCLGSGHFTVGTLFNYSPCEGESLTVAIDGQAGKHLRLRVEAGPTTRWRLLITSGR